LLRPSPNQPQPHSPDESQFTCLLVRSAWLVVTLLVAVLLLNDLGRQMLATMVMDIPGIANKADWAVHLVFWSRGGRGM